MGFLLMGFTGYFVKLIHIPIINIMWVAGLVRENMGGPARRALVNCTDRVSLAEARTGKWCREQKKFHWRCYNTLRASSFRLGIRTSTI